MAEVIKFNELTDYTAAETIVTQMYSDLESCKCGGKGDCGKGTLREVSTIMVAMRINKTTNVARWQDNIKVAYKLLKKVCKC